MASTLKKRKCAHCGTYFRPDPRNAKRQKFCTRPECRKAGQARSQRRWLQKNPDYFRGPENVRRVQEWRKAHPGYWRREKEPLQEPLIGNLEEDRPLQDPLTVHALQDLLSVQPSVLIGLIAHLTGSALQDDIASTTRRLQQLGDDILNPPKGAHCDRQAPPLSRPHDPRPIQLGGSAFGP